MVERINTQKLLSTDIVKKINKNEENNDRNSMKKRAYEQAHKNNDKDEKQARNSSNDSEKNNKRFTSEVETNDKKIKRDDNDETKTKGKLIDIIA
jgi:hypothetical protein